MKKWLCTLITASMVFTLAACGGSAAVNKSAETKAPETETAQAVETVQEVQVETEAPEAESVQEVEPGTDEIAAEAVPETGLEGPDDGWTRTGLFASDNGYMFSISWMDSEVDGGPGWYIAAQLGEDYLTDSYGGFVKMEDGALKGTLTSGESEEAVAVTISEEGEDGLVLAIDGADSYQFAPMDWEDLIEDYTDDSYYYEYEEETGESEA